MFELAADLSQTAREIEAGEDVSQMPYANLDDGAPEPRRIRPHDQDWDIHDVPL